MGAFRYPTQENIDDHPRQGLFGLFVEAVSPMHNFIQKLRNALRAENAIYAQLYRFLALLQTPYFPGLVSHNRAQQYSKGTAGGALEQRRSRALSRAGTVSYNRPGFRLFLRRRLRAWNHWREWALGPEQVEAVLRAIRNVRDRAFFWLLYDGGLRC
jgi:hypothetical protein